MPILQQERDTTIVSPTVSHHSGSSSGREPLYARSSLLSSPGPPIQAISPSLALSNDVKLRQDLSGLRRGKSLNFGPSSSSSPLASSSFAQSRPTVGPPTLALLSFGASTTGIVAGPSSAHSHSTKSGGSSSPVTGSYPRSPWAPTSEEASGLGSPGLRRGNSTSRTIGSAGIQEEPTPLSSEAGIHHQRSISSSIPAPAVSKRRLPPLMTNPEALANLSRAAASAYPGQNNQPSFASSRQGPASASAYVPPIGHSHHLVSASAQQNISHTILSETPLASIAEPSRPNSVTANPNVAPDWATDKERLIGPTAGATESTGVRSHLGGGDAWPAGGGFGVGVVMQQQAQIQALQSQMQMAMHKMEGLAIAPEVTPSPPVVANVAGARRSGTDGDGVAEMIAQKGYNPSVFDLRPPGVR